MAEVFKDRYDRQVRLIGNEAQEKISRTKVAVVGCGALGNASANLLARAGVGLIRLVDIDKVEASNLQRQTLFRESDIGKGKAEALANHLKSINSECKTEAVKSICNSKTAESLLNDVDIIVDATDNARTRDILNSFAANANKPFAFAAAIRHEGMAALFCGRPCYRCLFPNLPSDESCSSEGVLNAAVTAAAGWQVSEILSYLSGKWKGTRLISFDMQKDRFDILKVKANSGCKICKS
jgi:adenylyltransferase/sulfurtransferase